jgi:hypothetical protein
VSNKKNQPQPGSNSDQSAGDLRADLTQPESPQLQCTKCSATKVAHSRLQRFDALKMRFIATRPYRCLYCYHRFWVSEKIAASSKRVWTLSIVALLLVLLVLKALGIFSVSEQATQVTVVVPEPKPTPGQPSARIASSIGMPQDVDQRNSSTNLQAAPSSTREFTQAPDKLLTPEQRARQLLQAKQQAKAAAQLSQARVAQLEQALLPAEQELESLVKIELGYMLERWREAWSAGDLSAYLLSYSAEFKPSNELSFAQWKDVRKSRVSPQKKISVELGDFEVAMLDQLNSGVVEFNQRYQSGDYVENSRKRLSLVKEQGAWKITSEVELPQ